MHVLPPSEVLVLQARSTLSPSVRVGERTRGCLSAWLALYHLNLFTVPSFLLFKVCLLHLSVILCVQVLEYVVLVCRKAEDNIWESFTMWNLGIEQMGYWKVPSSSKLPHRVPEIFV